ncbi:MAG: flavodoxin family protein [Selenomonas sp.]|nr:flavodoxin family protein [Selenomonas sp.]
MSKILLIDSSPRRMGNSSLITEMLAEDLSGNEVRVFHMREKNCRPCLACAACQGKDTQMCVQKDDIAALLPYIESCDAMVIAAPIYNHQINSQAKLLIERLYPFFKMDGKNMSNTSKYGKKAALICSCWGSPREVMERYAKWTVEGLAQMGAEEFRYLVFDGIPDAGDVKKREDYLEELHELAKWLINVDKLG